MYEYHVPVMLEEVMEWLKPMKGENFIDGTFGGGGYSRAIAKACYPGKVVGFDLDPLAHKQAEKLKNEEGIDNIEVIHDNFSKIMMQPERESWLDQITYFDGLVLDLGLSSAQLVDRERGFSFQMDSPLDMGFGGEERSVETTEGIVNTWSEKEIERILREYGEEPLAKKIAKTIVAKRAEGRITTTGQLLDILAQAVPARFQHGQKHFATRTFQALRIATNDELGSLKKALKDSLTRLKPGGRIVVVSYHSLEDRIVKQFFRDEAIDCICPPTFPVCSCDHRASLKVLTKKPVLPTEGEIEENPRARSAKLRAAIKL
ncbi:16S rRNA (cytosine(1402)-N(4))-methyltransferase RsmH [Candidatus Falkowbacteria bacterium]|nr:16S rRNA (cytosine(1402)-N(4))-methyltransferase RsmH [Candidatus Falkowbacteria bacterium]